MNMAVGNTLFKKRASHLVTYETGPSKTQVDYFLVRSNQKLLKDKKVLPSDDYLSQPKPLVCEFKIRKVKDPRRKFVPRRMIWKLHIGSLKNNFRSNMNRYRASSQKDASVES